MQCSTAFHSRSTVSLTGSFALVESASKSRTGLAESIADPTVVHITSINCGRFLVFQSFSVDTSLHRAALAAYGQLSQKWFKLAWSDNFQSKHARLLAETPGPHMFAAHWPRHEVTSFKTASSGGFLP